MQLKGIGKHHLLERGQSSTSTLRERESSRGHDTFKRYTGVVNAVCPGGFNSAGQGWSFCVRVIPSDFSTVLAGPRQAQFLRGGALKPALQLGVIPS